jgi:hypothetical protein
MLFWKVFSEIAIGPARAAAGRQVWRKTTSGCAGKLGKATDGVGANHGSNDAGAELNETE